ncbi:hypothetical protein [Shimia sp. R11_0]|nr:hypothetical protein [Shimia sp. R11_0]
MTQREVDSAFHSMELTLWIMQALALILATLGLAGGALLLI